MFQDGFGWVPDEIISNATVFVLGQNPGATEEHEGRPFVGKTGAYMVERFFPAAGLERGINVSIGNALRCRWNRSDKLPPESVLKPALAHCHAAHFRPGSRTRLVVAQGALAWRVLGGPGQITQWRGFLKPSGMETPPNGHGCVSPEQRSQSTAQSGAIG